jgi:putative iron-regulated protein
LDEAYIDYVVGNPNAGIINNSTIYPAITLELLEGLNEQGGEKNISVGFHAIEFLLWGQDLSASGPGNRSYRDYVDGGARNADRRRTYLRLASAMLVDKLNWVAARWDSANPASYAQSFTSEGDLEALRRILIGPYRMAREELSQERMFVAYDTQSQEEEHSCFSDTTHLDIQFNFLGIRRVLEGSNVLELIRVRAPNLARDIDTQLALAELTIMGIPAPFDNAIFSNDGRLAILRSVESLESLADAIRAGAQSLGVALQ